jgi:small GTP-binding protein
MAGRAYDQLHKYVLIGDDGVGKTSFLVRAAEDSFSERMPHTIGVDFKILTRESLGKTLKLQLWDVFYRPRIRTVANAYCRGAHAVLVMFDITHLSTFRRLKHWLMEVERYASPDVLVVIVGSKSDLHRNRQVDQHIAKEFAEALGHS